jgi:NAD(P)-dependent dehydrogenase (short-subunit alcohol dehydrogenase family)
VLDLGTQSSVAAFTDAFASQVRGLDVLINNAGANFMGVAPWHTSQGVAGLPQVNPHWNCSTGV